MTDSAISRERRRMKILMQSEERMKKLMGYSVEKISTENNAKIVTDCHCDAKDEADLEKVKPEPLENGSLEDSNVWDGVSDFIEEDSETTSTVKEFLTKSTLDDDRVESTLDDDRVESTLDDDQPTVPDIGELVNKSTCDSLGQYRCCLMLIMGVIVRISFHSSFGSKYIQTIFYPFMAAEIAIWGYQRSAGLDPVDSFPGGIWLTVLHLTGVKTDVIESYKCIMGTLFSVLNDFAVYFFVFIVVHTIL